MSLIQFEIMNSNIDVRYPFSDNFTLVNVPQVFKESTIEWTYFVKDFSHHCFWGWDGTCCDLGIAHRLPSLQKQRSRIL